MIAVVVTFERLPVGFLGCYGNQGIETPRLDRLAANSVVFDQHFAENVDPDAPNHAWWTGCYQFPGGDGRERNRPPDLFAALTRQGVDTTMMAEPGLRPRKPDLAENRFFEVGGRDGLEVSAVETPFGRLVERAEGALERRSSEEGGARLLWLMSRGVPPASLPPRAFARRGVRLLQQASGAEPPPPLQTGRRATRQLDEDPHRFDAMSDEEFDRLVRELVERARHRERSRDLTPDQWKCVRAAFGGYVMLLDDRLGGLLDRLNETFGREELLLIVTAAQGAAVGERAMMSLPELPLSEAVVHTPLLMRSSASAPARRQQLVQTIDLAPTLLQWFGAETPKNWDGQSLLPLLDGREPPWRETLYLGDDARAAGIRTQDFYLVQEWDRAMGPVSAWTSPPIENRGAPVPEAAPRSAVRESSFRLFVKPEDIWETNDVSEQAPDEAAALREKLRQFVSSRPAKS